MKITLHQNHQVIGDLFSKLEELKKHENDSGLHVFPELYLTGYPLKDLCVAKFFWAQYLEFLKELEKWNLKRGSAETCFLVGGLNYSFEEGTPDVPQAIENGVFALEAGKPLNFIYSKRLLPNYDIFDEGKYFIPGSEQVIWSWQGLSIAPLICEDMWPGLKYSVDPVEELIKLQEQGTRIDLIINLSASPYDVQKDAQRKERALSISDALNAPFYYVNPVGLEDEVLFDGRSFIVDRGEVTHEAAAFGPDTISAIHTSSKNLGGPRALLNPGHYWEALFNPNLEEARPLTLSPLGEKKCASITEALIFALNDYASKNKMDSFLVALSGGIDSALVLALAHLASVKSGRKVQAIFMPGLFSSPVSYALSEEMCENSRIPLSHMPIKFLHSTVRQCYRESMKSKLWGASDENIQSRLRGSLLYAHSNMTGAMAINTSNKSELAVGYSTLYGDSVGAISLIGDLYKTHVFELSLYLNTKYPGLIPDGIIKRPPSAELRENQEDSQSLPPYERLDTILEGLLSYRFGPEELIEKGLPSKEVSQIYDLLMKSEYKRYQFCPIVKLWPKSFGFGYRMPISKMVEMGKSFPRESK